MTDHELNALADSLLAQDRAAKRKPLPPLGTLPPLVLSPADLRMDCEHEWHRFGFVNGREDVACQKCGMTRD